MPCPPSITRGVKSYTRSAEMFERAKKSLAGGVSSEFRKFGYPHPLFYTHGRGSRIVDVDENEYLDFTLSQGPLILGHSHPEVLAQVEAASREGQLFAGQYLQEMELAETLQRLIPCAELVRFSLSGSEADHAALRVARAVTGRPRFIRFEGHYHGWLDNVAFGIGGTASDIGDREHPNAVPWTQGLPASAREEFILLPWNDLDLLTKTVEARHDEIAAIITEPVMCNSGCVLPKPGFLEGLRELCTRFGIALIFDEVITGFRLGLSGAQGYFGVTPDLAVFAKAIANGYPISVLAGQRKWMQPIADGKVIHAGTLNSGNPSVAAALATLTVLERDASHARMFALGKLLADGLREVAQATHQNLRVMGPGPMLQAGFTDLETISDYRDTLSYDRPKYAKFVAGMHERGIRLIGRGLWYLSAVHTEADIDQAVTAAREVLSEL